MKAKKLLFGVIFLAAFLMVLPMNVWAVSTTALEWIPNDNNLMFSIYTSNPAGTGSNSFYLFDFGDSPAIANALFIFDDGTSPSITTVSFLNSGGMWTAYNGLGDSLDLGTSNHFGFFFAYGATPSGTYDYSGSNSAYTLDNGDTGMSVIVTNANPVPIPAAVWMFGAGLIGLVGIRSRSKFSN